jgi:hypothetical protein
MKKTKSAAVLTIFDPANFSPKGKRAIVKWLRYQATFLSRNSRKLAKRFTARYLYLMKV